MQTLEEHTEKPLMPTHGGPSGGLGLANVQRLVKELEGTGEENSGTLTERPDPS